MARLVLSSTAIVAVWGVMACSAETKPGAVPAAKAAAAPASKPTTSLACDGGTFSKVRLKNAKSRSYEECSLTEKAEGVIWVATAEGHALKNAETKLTFKDDRGRQFGHTCWTRSGTINGVTQTELILFGPEDSKKVTVCCGESCAAVQLE